jgi:hypothetical protein
MVATARNAQFHGHPSGGWQFMSFAITESYDPEDVLLSAPRYNPENLIWPHDRIPKKIHQKYPGDTIYFIS